MSNRTNFSSISIHALLAESDAFRPSRLAPGAYFYPRSPCGERHETYVIMEATKVISIHALLAESDGTPISEIPVGW